MNLESPKFSSDEYEVKGADIIRVERNGAEPGNATRTLLEQAFGILAQHLDLVEWAACCVWMGEMGTTSLRRFLRAKLTGHAAYLTGHDRTTIQVINSYEEIPEDDEYFARENFYGVDSDDEFSREVRGLIASADTSWRVYIYAKGCFWETWRAIQNRHAHDVNGAWSLQLAGIMLHEMVHQHARMLKEQGIYREVTGFDPDDPDAWYYHSNKPEGNCNWPYRVQNTFLWAMAQRYPRGSLFSDESYDENSCADEVRVDPAEGIWPADAYNWESNGFDFPSAVDCLRAYRWEFPDDLTEYPCVVKAPE